MNSVIANSIVPDHNIRNVALRQRSLQSFQFQVRCFEHGL
jgi:hypothetical protein